MGGIIDGRATDPIVLFACRTSATPINSRMLDVNSPMASVLASGPITPMRAQSIWVRSSNLFSPDPNGVSKECILKGVRNFGAFRIWLPNMSFRYRYGDFSLRRVHVEHLASPRKVYRKQATFSR